MRRCQKRTCRDAPSLPLHTSTHMRTYIRTQVQPGSGHMRQTLRGGVRLSDDKVLGPQKTQGDGHHVMVRPELLNGLAQTDAEGGRYLESQHKTTTVWLGRRVANHQNKRERCDIRNGSADIKSMIWYRPRANRIAATPGVGWDGMQTCQSAMTRCLLFVRQYKFRAGSRGRGARD
ncbi:hypothetical protein LY76DRAFT_253062 [Colletotrichum caudatum]|nr:hypothetical protein LY76DRAFT_253062 [Colletotrichum caudatum]